jgi:hypothetical protein
LHRRLLRDGERDREQHRATGSTKARERRSEHFQVHGCNHGQSKDATVLAAVAAKMR